MLDNISSVVVLGTRNTLALPLIRSMAALIPGVAIHTLSPALDRNPIAEMSRHVQSHHRLEFTTEDELFDQLVSQVRKTGRTLLLPTEERFIRLITSRMDELEPLVLLPPFPRTELLEQVTDKGRLNRLLQDHHLPHAGTRPAETADPDRYDGDDFPLLLKPKHGFSGIGIIRVHTRDELARKLSRVNRSEYIVQEYVPGYDIDCSFLAKEGTIEAYTIQRVLARSSFGISSALKFTRDPQIEDYTRHLVSRTGYNGVAHLDFRYDERDRQVKLVDFNARFWITLVASRAAGVDFVRLCCMRAAGIPLDPPYPYEEITYFVGRNSLSHYIRCLTKPKYRQQNSPVITDLWYRLSDPVPEMARYLQSAGSG